MTMKSSKLTGWPPRLEKRKLTAEQVARIRAAAFGDVAALAEEFGISRTAAHYIRRRYVYKDLP